MKRAAGLLWAALALSACGGDPPVVVELALGSTYDVTGVARVLPDGQTPASLRPLSFRYDMLASSAGRLVGTVVSAQGQAEISGDFDAKKAQFTVAPFMLALTGTVTERIAELGGVGFDGSPEDGRIDDMSGFVRAEIGRSAVQAYTIAASRVASRPAQPDASKITARSTGLGRAQATGSAGAILGFTGVELFVHGLAIAQPKFTLGQAREDGSFDVEIPGSAGDMVVIRARTAGVAGEAVVVSIAQ